MVVSFSMLLFILVRGSAFVELHHCFATFWKVHAGGLTLDVQRSCLLATGYDDVGVVEFLCCCPCTALNKCKRRSLERCLQLLLLYWKLFHDT